MGQEKYVEQLLMRVVFICRKNVNFEIWDIVLVTCAPYRCLWISLLVKKKFLKTLVRLIGKILSGFLSVKQIFSITLMLFVALVVTTCDEALVYEESKDVSENGFDLNLVDVAFPNYHYFEEDSFGSFSEEKLYAGNDSTCRQYERYEVDEIGVFPDNGVQVVFSKSNIEGALNGIFAGNGCDMNAFETYSAYSPVVYAPNLDKNFIPVDLSTQKQKGNSNSCHIRNLSFMTAINSMPDDEGHLTFKFKYQVCILHLKISVPIIGKYNRLMLMASANLTTKVSLNLLNGDVNSKEQMPIQVLVLDEVSVADVATPLDLFMVINPVDMTGKTFKARLYAEDGTVYVVSLPSYNYEAGNFYHIKRVAVVDQTETGLPTVFVNTPIAQLDITKTDWQDGTNLTILMPDGSVDYCGSMQIKGRGNTSWNFLKKPYALKLDENAEILGMPKHNRWCLLSNWMDKTLMRNAVAFEISRITDLDWTPSGRFVELVFNGVHCGNYYICEQIKVNSNRVDVGEFGVSGTEGDCITGGYIFELDAFFDKNFKFRPLKSKLPWMFKDPDKVNEAQYNWAVNYVNELEETLYDSTRFAKREFVDYMDLESFIDYWFVFELTMNPEIGQPKSCYLHKNSNGKLTAGPVWDFDWGTFTPSATSYYNARYTLYYPFLFNDATFVAMVKSRWASFKPDFETKIPAFVDATSYQIKKSAAINSKMWPIINSKPNGDETLPFDEAVKQLKAAYFAKLKWLDNQIQNM